MISQQNYSLDPCVQPKSQQTLKGEDEFRFQTNNENYSKK